MSIEEPPEQERPSKPLNDKKNWTQRLVASINTNRTFVHNAANVS